MHFKGLFLGSLITVTSAGTTRPPPLLFAAVEGSSNLRSGSLARDAGSQAPLFSDTVVVQMKNPQILTYDPAYHRLYVFGGVPKTGLIESYQSQAAGSMSLKLNRVLGATKNDELTVSSDIYKQGNYMIKVSSQKIWTYTISTDFSVNLNDASLISQSSLPVDARQIIPDDAENPRFFLVIDYGSKMVHAFQSKGSIVLPPPVPMKLSDGVSSPKKAIIIKNGQQKFLCLIADGTNSLIVFKIGYQETPQISMTFMQTDYVVVTKKSKATVTDIVIGKNNPKFFLTTVSGDPVDKDSKFDPLITWSVNADGKLTRVKAAGATGLNPTHAAITDNGDLLVLALGQGNLISVLQLNPQTGIVERVLVNNENIGAAVKSLVIAE